MKRFASIAVVVLVCSLALGFAARDSVYLKIAKSLSIFSDLFRQISNDYVDELDPQEFIEAGIEGMLKHLDPYTMYIDDESHDEVDIITTGVYGGLGITTATIDSAVTVMSVTEDSPAEKAGVRIGDRLYMIDTTVILNISSNELRRFTRGKPGTKLSLKVLRSSTRAGLKDTLTFQLARQEVTLRNVTYCGLVGEDGTDAKDMQAANTQAAKGLPKDIGYIRLERFTHSASSEVAEAINKLRKEHPALKGWILDVRDNPGGLLDAAVGISELFVPKGSFIVSTRGRLKEQEHSYYSGKPPVEPDAPLVVMINDRSASASEIVAGAIQDLDRGVILGEPSFGKGLVQTISSLPYNATLKMTTAKYYTPSGRCIQKIDYNQRRHGMFKSMLDTNTLFRTRNGRPVKGFSGIRPDTTLSLQMLSPIVEELANRQTLFAFANDYAGGKTSLPEKFTVNKQIMSEFIAFVRRKNGQRTNPALKEVDDLEKTLKQQGAQASLKTVEGLRSQLSKDYFKELERQHELIADVLREEILERFYPRSKVIAQTLSDDIQTQAAVRLLHNNARYRAMLGEQQR
jgi:carboxyl-terminal processing protease